MKPQKSDFGTYLTFSLNIKDASINPHIEAAFKFDIKPRLGTLAVDIYNYVGTGRPELKTFYDNFVVQWWVFLATKRFLEIHGHNITQYGYTKLRDPDNTFEPITLQERAIYLKRLDSDADVLYSLLLNEVWTFDSTTYRKPTDDCNPTGIDNFGISPLGTRR